MGKLRDLFRRREFTPLEYAAYALDRANELGDRQECIDAMGAFDEPAVEAALIRIASDPSEDEWLRDSAGESLWELWRRQGRVPPRDIVATFLPEAKKFFPNEP